MKCPPICSRLRRRGGFLLFRALIYAGYGYSLTGLSQTPALRHATRFATSLMPLNAWGAVWIASAVVMLIAAFMPPPRDYVGFAAGGAMPLIWAALSAITWWQNGHITQDRTWVNVVVFLGLAGSALIVAGMRDPERAE